MSKDRYPNIFLKSNLGYCFYFPSNSFHDTQNFTRFFLKFRNMCLYIWMGRRGSREKISKKCMENWKLTERLLAQPRPSNFGEYNLLPDLVKLQFISCAIWKNFAIIRFSYKRCNFWRLCLPSKMAWKAVMRPVVPACGSLLLKLLIFEFSEIIPNSSRLMLTNVHFAFGQ